jgi:biotin transport system substrate-specific component
MKKKKSAPLVLTALFAALISAGCFIQIPLPGGVPVAIQDMLAMLSGMILGPLYGTAAVLVFLVLGCIGLPVFTGKAGVQVILAGPTGGFLIGYLLGALAAGILLAALLPFGRRHSTAAIYIVITMAALVATFVLFACGIVRFMQLTGYEFGKTMAAVLIPFIPGNVVKLILMVMLTKKFRPIVLGYLRQD